MGEMLFHSAGDAAEKATFIGTICNMTLFYRGDLDHALPARSGCTDKDHRQRLSHN